MFTRYGVPQDVAEQWFHDEHLPESKVVERGSIDYGNTNGKIWTRATDEVLTEDGDCGTLTVVTISARKVVVLPVPVLHTDWATD